MKWRSLLFCALSFCLGCASEGETGKWDDFWKDLRGDNMQMKSDFTRTKASDDHPASTKSQN